MVQEVQDDRAKEDLYTSVAHLYQDENGFIKWSTIERILKEEGLSVDDDPRVQKALHKLSHVKPNQCKEDVLLNIQEYKQIVLEDATMLSRALIGSLRIRDFYEFSCKMRQVYEDLHQCTKGQIMKTDELYSVNGEEWCVSIVTVDGQKASFGRKSTFTLDDLCGPLIHGLAIDLLGADVVNMLPQATSQFPPDRRECYTAPQSCGACGSSSWFLTDAAMILMCSMIKSVKIEDWNESMKHDYVLSFFKGICGGQELRFSNATYSHSKGTHCKLNALAHFLKAFTKNRSHIPHIDTGLDLFFQLRSMEVTTDSLAMIAAFLANGGTSPYNNSEVLSQEAVANLLTTMYSAGLGKSSSLFAVQCGVPAICIKSGAMMVAIPGLMGVGLYSPKIECCCSVRSYNFIMELTKVFGLHPYCKLDNQTHVPKKGKSIKKEIEFDKDPQWPIFWAAANGNIDAITEYVKEGLNLNKLVDGTGLTLLHVAAAHGHLELVKYLFCTSPDLLFATDKWQRKACEYAEKNHHEAIQNYLCHLELETRKSMLLSALDDVAI